MSDVVRFERPEGEGETEDVAEEVTAGGFKTRAGMEEAESALGRIEGEEDADEGRSGLA